MANKIEPSFSIGFGPVNFGLRSGADSSGYDEAFKGIWEQKNFDFQNQQWRYAIEQNRINRLREDTRIQALVRDARQAGISPLAAMGGAAASPASINIPHFTPVTGRVSGRYQRSANAIASIQLDSFLRNDQQDSDYKKWRNHEQQYRALSEETDYWTKRYQQVFGPQPINLYVPVHDNSDLLRKQYGDEITYGLNPDLNYETPEHIGGYYHYRENVFPTKEGYQNGPSLLGIP
jgi:hypothetical protein